MDGYFFQIGGKEIEGADDGTFEVIDQSYAKDINFIYYDGRPIEAGLPNSVEFVASELNGNSQCDGISYLSVNT